MHVFNVTYDVMNWLVAQGFYVVEITKDAETQNYLYSLVGPENLWR